MLLLLLHTIMSTVMLLTGSPVVVDSPPETFITLPANYDPAYPAPLVIYAHGSSGNERSLAEPGMNEVYDALLRNGYIVAASAQHGNNWGSQQSVDDIANLYTYMKENYSVSELFLIGHSMGGASSLQAAVSLDADAWLGIYPVTNLTAMHDNGRYGQAIDAANPDYASHDPSLMDSKLFDFPMRFYASNEDTIVPAAQNSLEMAGRVVDSAPECAVVMHTGEHGDPSAFQPDDVVQFFDRVDSAG